jgi:glycosyltransferase involved in cell wall biosynthesis
MSTPSASRRAAYDSATDRAPLAVVMISLNEAHQMAGVLDNVLPLAQEVFLVDSHSSDETVNIALARGVTVVQRAFRGFGDQWNFALQTLPIRAPWTMKLDPDERVSPELASSIRRALTVGDSDAYTVDRRLWFMGKPLPVRQRILRLWRTGTCRFSDVLVNEHPLLHGARIGHLPGDLEHHDSPSLEHWLDKQNRYSSAEARSIASGAELSGVTKLFGTPFERRMWLKKNFRRFPLRHQALFWAHYLGQGAWRAGREGLIWARLRADVQRMIEYKLHEIEHGSREAPPATPRGTGVPDPRVPQY